MTDSERKPEEKMKVFQMNDCDWMAGETLEACKAEYLRMYWHGLAEDEAFDSPYELSSGEMDKLRFNNEELDKKWSFRDQLNYLIQQGHKFPTFFASTEY